MRFFSFFILFDFLLLLLLVFGFFSVRRLCFYLFFIDLDWFTHYKILSLCYRINYYISQYRKTNISNPKRERERTKEEEKNTSD